MNQRQAQYWVWWLLPFLAARALVPAGFMTNAADHFRLVMCSEVVSLKRTATGVVDVTVLQGSQSTDHQSVTHAPCLFAGSALPPLITTTHVLASLCTDCVGRTLVTPITVFASRYDAAHAIRGPPAVS